MAAVNSIGARLAQSKSKGTDNIYHWLPLVKPFFFFIVLQCPTLLFPLNGPFVAGKCYSSYGSTCWMRCPDGYDLLGARKITCEAKPGHTKGYWNQSPPVCKGDWFSTQYWFLFVLSDGTVVEAAIGNILLSKSDTGRDERGYIVAGAMSVMSEAHHHHHHFC